MRPVGVDLDGDGPVRQELGVGEVGADHQQQVAAVERDGAGAVAEQAGLADLVRVVVLQALLRLQAEHHRRLQPLRQREHLVPGVTCALADQHRHLRRGVDRPRGLADRLRRGRGRRLLDDEARDRGVLVDVEPADVPGQGEDGDAPLLERGVAGLLDHPGELVRTA